MERVNLYTMFVSTLKGTFFLKNADVFTAHRLLYRRRCLSLPIDVILHIARFATAAKMLADLEGYNDETEAGPPTIDLSTDSE